MQAIVAVTADIDDEPFLGQTLVQQSAGFMIILYDQELHWPSGDLPQAVETAYYVTVRMNCIVAFRIDPKDARIGINRAATPRPATVRASVSERGE